MEVVIWGTRGSVPVASQDTVRFGGNTTCIEICTDAGDCIILDAGTGIRALGEHLLKEGRKQCTLCFTHAHLDHLQGLPFFAPLYDPSWNITVRGPDCMGKKGVKTSLEYIFNGHNFPLEMSRIGCSLNIIDFKSGDCFDIGSARIETCATNHPGGNVAYRVTADGWSFVFTGDHESGCNGDASSCSSSECRKLARFMKRADVVLADAQYTKQEYLRFKGRGHSCMEFWPRIAMQAGVDHLIFTHHDPSHTDADLDILTEKACHDFSHLPLTVDFAREGMRISGTKGTERNIVYTNETLSCWLCDVSQELSGYNDVGTILDSILSEARRVTRADAGTVYLTEDDELVFAYTQNDTLFPGSARMRHVYQHARVPINTLSIAGYAADTRKSLKIDDVRSLPSDTPYKFYANLDKESGYRTVSLLTVPLILKDRILGVLQLINHLNENNTPEPFDSEMEARVNCLANIAVHALERGLMARDLILRMLEITALRDPSETGNHVRRVGAMAAEIYHRWAERNNIEPQELRRTKDHICLAAMLHDVGKVGIPDSILKKEGPLTAEERVVIEQHTAMGAHLFTNVSWEVDAMAQEIALHHHQKWDGTGYTGDANEPVLSGCDIPLHARITAVADVYDALLSPRCYKKAFSKEYALSVIMEGKGKHFDPEILDAFFDVVDVMDAIRLRYPN